MTSRAPLFASARERRLWTWTLVVVAAIYASIGLARSLASALQERELFDGAFAAGALLVLATIVTQGLRSRPSGRELGIALGVVAVYGLVFVRMAAPVERSHLVEYGVVAVFVYEALTERARCGRRVPVPALSAIAVTAAIGVLDECIQGLVPSRVLDPLDMLFDLVAAVLAVGTCAALRWARGRGR